MMKQMIMSMTVIRTTIRMLMIMDMKRLTQKTNWMIMLLAMIVFQEAVPNDYTNVAVAACDDGM